MYNRKNAVLMLFVTLLTTIILVVTVLFCARKAGDEITRHSFEELQILTKQLASDYHSTVNGDSVILTAMAELIAEQGTEDTDAALRVMKSFSLEKTFIADVELLLPNGQLLNQNGIWHDASEEVDFESEAKKGAYISDRVCDFIFPEKLVLRNAVPVVKNGKALAMLYGVIPLQEASRAYPTELYGGKSFVLIVDGTTGDILLDTWHDTLGNLSDLKGRKTIKGHTYEQAVDNIKHGKSGDMHFVSEKTNSIIYMHYEPVGINNWSVTIGVREEDALSGTRMGVKILYYMTAVVAVVLLLFMLYVIWYLVSARRSVYRMSITDKCTGLKNRRAYELFLNESKERIFDSVVCIYIDANGLHEINNRYGHEAGDKMLQSVAECLREHFSNDELYRVGGDEFVVFPKELGEAECEERLNAVLADLATQGYSISYGIAVGKGIHGLSKLVSEADEKMLDNKRAYYAGNERRRPR